MVKQLKKFLLKFKELSLFDLLLGLGLFLVALSFFLFFFRKNIYLKATIKVTDDNVLYAYTNSPSWFSFLFYKGISEKDGLGKTQAEVLDVLLYPISPNTKAAYLTVKLKTVYDKRKNQYSFKGEPVLIGNPLKLNFENLAVEGLVIDVEGFPKQGKEIEVISDAQLLYESPVFPETQGVPDYIANAFSVGDKSHDSQKNVLVEILEKRVVSADKVVTDDKGNLLVRKDPFRKDVFLKLRVRLKQINNELYFLDTLKFAIGQSIPVQLEKVTIDPVITEIYSDSTMTTN